MSKKLPEEIEDIGSFYKEAASNQEVMPSDALWSKISGTISKPWFFKTPTLFSGAAIIASVIILGVLKFNSLNNIIQKSNVNPKTDTKIEVRELSIEVEELNEIKEVKVTISKNADKLKSSKETPVIVEIPKMIESTVESTEEKVVTKDELEEYEKVIEEKPSLFNRLKKKHQKDTLGQIFKNKKEMKIDD